MPYFLIKSGTFKIIQASWGCLIKSLEMNTVLLIVTGLVLFLYALNNLSRELTEISGDRLKSF
jgi:hypothetical protein